VDVTVADLVADLRAATPSEAAEAVVPERRALQAGLAALARRLAHALRGRVREGRSRLRALARVPVLRRPEALLRMREQRLDDAAAALARGWRGTLEAKRARLERAGTRLAALSPTAVLARGYSVTLDARTGALVRDAADAPPGTTLETRLARGRLRATVSESVSGEELDGQATGKENA
jgi:exodeoxyribonuclease VII large subunit